jgi:hypothetical protein
VAVVELVYGRLPDSADLPIMPRSTLNTLALRKEDAVTDAKQSIDQLLARQK